MKNTITILKKLISLLNCNLTNLLWVILSIVYVCNSNTTNVVVFLNVGQGDATLIQQGDFQILIDGGDGLELLDQISLYMSFRDRVIDIVVLTHPHDDHLVGILELIERYEIGELWIYPICFNNKNYELLLSSDLNVREVHEGMSFKMKEIYIDILWPRVGAPAKCTVGKYKSWDENINNDSIVMQIEYLDKVFLLMGDAEKQVERELKIEKEVDFLKAGHHCSKTSSSETFLKMVKPAYAICSCGEGNKFGHPDSGTLKNFSSLGVQYFVTYLEGNIVVR